MEFYILDTETNGLARKNYWHEITQITVIRCKDKVQFNRYIKIEYPERTSKEALIATNRTIADLDKGIKKEQAVIDLDSFLNQDELTPEHRCVIGHNVRFDRDFCAELYNSVGKIFPAVCWLDTKDMAKDWAKKMGIVKPSLKLKSCIEMCEIKSKEEYHNAVGDTRNTYKLYNFLKNAGIDHLPMIKRANSKESNGDDC